MSELRNGNVTNLERLSAILLHWLHPADEKTNVVYTYLAFVMPKPTK